MPLTSRLLWHLSGQLPQACPASVSAHSPRYGRPSPALPLVTSCHRFLSVWFVSPPKLALLSGTGASAGNSGLEESTSKDSHNTSLTHCPVLGRGPLAFPWAIVPFHPCSSQNSRAAGYWLSELGWPGREEAGLGWPLSSSEARLQWDLLHPPPRIAVPPDTPQASSSPPTPPTSFPPPEAEVTGSLGWGGVVITWQWGRRQGPGGCCLRDWVIWELESARTGSLARPEPVEAAALGLGDLSGSLQWWEILLRGLGEVGSESSARSMASQGTGNTFSNRAPQVSSTLGSVLTGLSFLRCLSMLGSGPQSSIPGTLTSQR